MAGRAAAAVVGGVHRDAVQPGGELCLPTKARQLGGQGKADVLGQILGGGALSGQPETDAEQPVIAARQQRRKGITVACRRGPGQILVAACHAHHNGCDARARSILGLVGENILVLIVVQHKLLAQNQRAFGGRDQPAQNRGKLIGDAAMGDRTQHRDGILGIARTDDHL